MLYQHVFARSLHRLTAKNTFLGATSKRFESCGPGPTDKEMLPAAQQVALKLRVTATMEMDGPGLPTAEVTFVPIRSNETLASPPPCK
jgi:hypothetical protein